MNKRPISTGKQFRVSLDKLYTNMSTCTPHFVRCIKPNVESVPYTFEFDFVMKQLQYTGMLATTRIRREGYAVRVPFKEFINRFRVLGFSHATHLTYDSTTCRDILAQAGITGFETGTTKMFLKHYHMDELETRILELALAAKRVQQAWRTYITLKKVRALCESVAASATGVLRAVQRQKAEDVERVSLTAPLASGVCSCMQSFTMHELSGSGFRISPPIATPDVLVIAWPRSTT